MKDLLSKVHIDVNESIYLKNPESSELGRKIIKGSIDMVHAHGFEDFTFKKLGKEIHSTEASIYRYFESKHKLLLYLTTWYWGWMEYRLVFAMANIPSSIERLQKALRLLTEQVKEDGNFSHINEEKLNYIVISESSKSYLTRDVDVENKHGVFSGYKEIVARISDIVLEINPNYKYPHMLISTVIEGAHLQRYFAVHLPRLTDVIVGEDSIVEFYKEMVYKAIK
ncbi:MAG: TetR family transcriptional regulator [Reichenbachiella sp.]